MSAPRILATGRCLPARVVTNEDLSRTVDTNDQWVFSRTGIHQRHFCTSETAKPALLPRITPWSAVWPPISA